jgi:hypothetical protein
MERPFRHVVEYLMVWPAIAYVAMWLAPNFWPGKPPAETVDRIERRLAKNKCVGRLGGWWRHYAYQVLAQKVNKGFVSVHYVEAGHDHLRSGRYVAEPLPPEIDDSQHRLVYAEYKIATSRFTNFTCGWNFPPRVTKDDFIAREPVTTGLPPYQSLNGHGSK